jgi:type I restriction enzyme R subunit
MDSVSVRKKLMFGKSDGCTSSRKNAVKYKKAFDKYLANTNNPTKQLCIFQVK